MRDKNPDLQAGEKKKYVMKPPQVLRHGSKKTSFANFLEICKMWVDFLSKIPHIFRVVPSFRISYQSR